MLHLIQKLQEIGTIRAKNTNQNKCFFIQLSVIRVNRVAVEYILNNRSKWCVLIVDHVCKSFNIRHWIKTTRTQHVINRQKMVNMTLLRADRSLWNPMNFSRNRDLYASDFTILKFKSIKISKKYYQTLSTHLQKDELIRDFSFIRQNASDFMIFLQIGQEHLVILF